MIIRNVFIFLFIASLYACGGRGIPNGIMKKEKMEMVMWDMLQADDFVREYMINRDSTLDDTAEYINMYERVFRMHGTTRDEFDRSFNYYREHPALMKEVMDSMNTKFQRLPPPVYVPPATPLPATDTSVRPGTRVDTMSIMAKRDSLRRMFMDTTRKRIKNTGIPMHQ
ncbi:MAG TPA: DUF4296 domain-containing protein [Chitinophagaceae bacterium]|jgi:hypothetical protein|nr:DUF4296 domain-containing protein [Chitinophagaceae bacterium]